MNNIRIKYTEHPQTGEIQILEEDHYYPYGLAHKGYSANHQTIGFDDHTLTLIDVTPDVTDTYKYKFNGMEWQDEFDVNVYDFGARNYDPALGRWMNIDPLTEAMRRHSPYNYAFNNPVYFMDPDGMMPFGSISIGNLSLDMNIVDTGRMLDGPNYIASTVVDRDGNIIDYQDDGDPNIYLNRRGGLVIGTEREGVEYKPGDKINQEDLNENFKLIDGKIHDYSRVNAEKKNETTKENDKQIDNCKTCDSRRCNGASHTDMSRAIKKGVDGATTPGGVTVGGATHWITKSWYGWLGAFAKGYFDDVYDQYNEYREESDE